MDGQALRDGRLALCGWRGDQMAARWAGHHRQARQTQEMAAALPDNGGVYMVPAFVGLGRAALVHGGARYADRHDL
jgi:glycerol kinase